MDEHLGGGLRVGEGTVAGAHLCVEPLGERAQVHPRQAAVEQPAGERDGVDHRGGKAPALEPGQLRVDEADVEARVVRHQHRALGEGKEAR